ncbi:hypothetical protein I6G46_13600 [Serratia plymuthica]|uniref:hypothetical protein n=1 Tax=Serratia plymuthica TaxID=82996 RepID=UPI0018D620B5|nr:hypothetical protein [Serratia plymuthica]QPS85247.1 hypothetical protein I6G46_13600 [Serratia plymuthica]
MLEQGFICGESRYVYDDYNDDEQSFILRNVTEHGNEIRLTYVHPVDRSFEGKEFYTFFFSKKNLKESDIYMIHDERQKRIGWIIPIISLDSVEHHFAQNEHFLRYSFIAFREALKNSTNEIFKKNVEKNNGADIESMNISDLFDDSTAVFIVSKETLPAEKIDNFDLGEYIPSFFSYGYVELTKKDPSLLFFEKEIDETETLKLHCASKDIGSIDYIRSMCSNILPYESNAIFRFFYIYQVIEMLMDIILNEEHKSIVQELSTISGDMSRIKELLDKLSESASEKKRIKLLIEKYTSNSYNMDELRLCCTELLTDLGKKPADGLAGFLYPIRNFITHQFRNFPPECINKLSDVTEEFITLLPKMLSNFKIPNTP